MAFMGWVDDEDLLGEGATKNLQCTACGKSCKTPSGLRRHWFHLPQYLSTLQSRNNDLINTTIDTGETEAEEDTPSGHCNTHISSPESTSDARPVRRRGKRKKRRTSKVEASMGERYTPAYPLTAQQKYCTSPYGSDDDESQKEQWDNDDSQKEWGAEVHGSSSNTPPPS
jgi:hypothetical protein